MDKNQDLRFALDQIYEVLDYAREEGAEDLYLKMTHRKIERIKALMPGNLHNRFRFVFKAVKENTGEWPEVDLDYHYDQETKEYFLEAYFHQGGRFLTAWYIFGKDQTFSFQNGDGLPYSMGSVAYTISDRMRPSPAPVYHHPFPTYQDVNLQ